MEEPFTEYIINPKTGRLVKTRGKVGREVIGVDICRLYKPRPGFAPKENQKNALALFQNMLDLARPKVPPVTGVETEASPWRGILYYYGLGSGKTCVYALDIDEYLSRPENANNKVYIFTSGALRNNFLNEYCGFCGKNRKNIGDRFVFYTYNYSMIKSKLPENLDNSLIVIDEVHHIINGKLHNSDQLGYVYDLIETSKNSFIIAGSGSPLLADYHELYFIWRLLIRMSLTVEQFEAMFTSTDDVIVPVNPDELREYLSGAIDYYSIEEKPEDIVRHYPDVITEYQNVKIHPDRLDAYVKIIQEELAVTPPNEEDRFRNPARYRRQMTAWYLAISHLRSRQASNYYYPVIERGDLRGTARDLDLPDDIESKDGWVTETAVETLDRHGEKITAILADVQENHYKHVIYTEFKTYHGSHLIGAFLDLLQIPYRFFDGDMNDSFRQQVLDEFNAKDNLHGEKVRVLVITDAGSEGINLLEVRKFHVLEQYISSWALKQATGRSIRYDSHVRLPVNERNVTIVNYMLDLEPLQSNDLSSDYLSLQQAQTKDYRIQYLQEFLKTLK